MGFGTLRDVLYIKEKHGEQFLKELGMVQKIVNTLQEKDRHSQRVG